MERRIILLFFIITCFVGCTSPQQEILGKWEIVKVVVNDKDVTRPEPGVRITMGYDTTNIANAIRVIEFCPNGEVIHYYDGVNHKYSLTTYKIDRDSIFLITKTRMIGGFTTEHFSSKYRLEGNKLTLNASDTTHTELERVK